MGAESDTERILTVEDCGDEGSETGEEEVEQGADKEEQVVAVAPPAGNTSTAGAVFLIVNAALGAGLLNFPAAFDQAGGVLAAVLVQAVLLLFIMVALIILAKTSDLKQSTTLQDVMETACGRSGRLATSLIITVYCFGTCITFLIIIGDQFDRAFASLVGPEFCHHWYLNRDFLVPASSCVLILPLCFTKKIDFLKYVSVFGVLTMVYVVGLILLEYFYGGHSPGRVKTAPDSWLDVFTVIPVICFGYQCHVSVIPIYSCMRHRNVRHFSLASGAAIAVCCFTYTGAATFGYLTFGSKVSQGMMSFNFWPQFKLLLCRHLAELLRQPALRDGGADSDGPQDLHNLPHPPLLWQGGRLEHRHQVPDSLACNSTVLALNCICAV